MREEYELEVLEKYDIEVKSTRRIRGAVSYTHLTLPTIA